LVHPTAKSAADAIARIGPHVYRPFNMLIADAEHAYCVRCTDGSEPDAAVASVGIDEFPAGLSMLTAYDCNSLRSPRIRRYLPKFQAAAAPRPDADDWSDWVGLLAARDFDPESGPGGAMTVVTSTGFGTVCSSLLALPARRQQQPIWLFAAGRPGETPFRTIRR
jgi:hypothetical protein